MHTRRRLLAALGTVSVTALGGCLADGGGSECSHAAAGDAGARGDRSTSSPPTDQVATLTADGGGDGDQFGSAVALSADGSAAAVGAELHEGANGGATGAAYVFGKSDGGWQQRAKLLADDGDDNDQFGRSVALSADGTIAVVGAHNDDNANGEDAGSAYVFGEADRGWQQQAKLLADDGSAHEGFGSSVGVSGDGCTAVIGAPSDDDPNGVKAGSAYAFGESGGSWQQRAKLAADDGDDRDLLGGAVAVSDDGSTAVVGANRDEGPDEAWGGSAYVFGESDGSWQQHAKLVADDADGEDLFGSAAAVSADGSTAIVGAGDEDPNGKDAGSAYAFGNSGGGWQQRAKLAADDGDRKDLFGEVVAVSGHGSTAVIGAPGDEDPNGRDAGSAYVFVESGGDWQQRAKLLPGDGDGGDWFGGSAAVSNGGGTAVIGAESADTPTGKGAGAVYVFE